MIKGIIFDLDGTLLDTIADIHNAVNLTLKEYGYPLQSYEYVKLKTGRGFRKLIEDVLPQGASEEEIQKVHTTYSIMYGKHYCEKTTAYEGIHELLQELNKLNIKIAVNSNKKDEYTKNLMKIIFPDIKFEAVFGERIGVPTKPNPAAANQIINIMNLDKQEVYYIGDSEVDIKTAKNAELKSIGCLWGFRDLNVLQEAGADIIVQNPSDILNYLGE